MRREFGGGLTRQIHIEETSEEGSYDLRVGGESVAERGRLHGIGVAVAEEPLVLHLYLVQVETRRLLNQLPHPVDHIAFEAHVLAREQRDVSEYLEVVADSEGDALGLDGLVELLFVHGSLVQLLEIHPVQVGGVYQELLD